ncbi:hypothetical protein PV350_14530 [Streptomyces sp. PA03-6a]|nr:hypothetical protein [Streptomyces sp. PA03-6a]
MKAVLLGVLLGLVVVFTPAAGTAVAGLLTAGIVALASQPVVWAFAAGVAARPRLEQRARRWTR